MSLPDLFDENATAVGNMTDKYFARLQALSVPHSALWSGASIVGALRVQTYEDGTWCPSPTGRPALIIPVGSRGPGNILRQDICDLIAIFSDTPNKWYLRAGIGVVLGEEQFDYARIHEEPLLLVTNPVGWLKAGTQAACILDWQAIHAPNWFEGCRVLCDTPELEKRLENALTPKIPNVSIKVWEQHDAA
jgi:hypothetical protein